MKEYLGDKEEPFSFPHMKARLKDQYGEDLLFAEINGEPNVVTFRGTASNILHCFFFQFQNMMTQNKKKLG